MGKLSLWLAVALLAANCACESKQEPPAAPEHREDSPLVREQTTGITKAMDVRVTRLEANKLEGESRLGGMDSQPQPVTFILTPQTERSGSVAPDSWVKVFYHEIGQQKVADRIIAYGGAPP